MNKKTILLATGGTGGHIFPAFALAEQLSNDFDIKFVGDQRYTKYVDIDDEKYFLIDTKPVSGNIAVKLYRFALLFYAILKAVILLKKIKPEYVIGFGGYPCFPSCFAANLLGIKYIVHEQNSILGKANKILGHNAIKIALSFKDTKDLGNIQNSIYTGNFVRENIKKLSKINYEPQEKINILVIGGSLGAKILSDIVPKAILNLPPNCLEKISITQQVIKEEQAKLSRIYNNIDFDFQISEFIENISNAYEKADLIISRAGATTIAELKVIKKPSILIPIANSLKNHQYLNAEHLSENGCAFLIEESDKEAAEKITSIITKVVTNKELLVNMHNNFKDITEGITDISNIIN